MIVAARLAEVKDEVEGDGGTGAGHWWNLSRGLAYCQASRPLDPLE
jgi:hypothetical protein